MKRKIIQIAFDHETDSEYGDLTSTAWGLCDDGTLWVWKYNSESNKYEWQHAPWMSEIPQHSVDESSDNEDESG